MLTKQLIKEIAGATIYNRGLELFKQNKVLTFKANNKNEEVTVKASVQGSGRKKYKVTLSYNALFDDVSE